LPVILNMTGFFFAVLQNVWFISHKIQNNK